MEETKKEVELSINEKEDQIKSINEEKDKEIEHAVKTAVDSKVKNLDKKKIFSVIHNRLEKNMKLQLDATTIYAITDGKYDLKRDLKIKDLKIKHPYNTYYIKGLPPGPISYVGKKTMEIIFENYKSKYLYYFYDNIVQKHIYSETYKDHKRKLSEYRSKK